jgi:hypothetical protein
MNWNRRALVLASSGYLALMGFGCRRNSTQHMTQPPAVPSSGGRTDSSKAMSMEKQTFTVTRKEGYVPNRETAEKIAEAVWIPIYGKDNIDRQRPFGATLRNGVWYVCGSLPEGWFGGTAEAEISRKDGRILRISHGK